MAKYIPLILFTVLTNAAAQIVLKQGMLVLGTFEFTASGIGTTLPRLLINPYFLLGLVLFVVSLGSLGAIGIVGAVLPLFMTVALTALEFLVAFLQAFIFATLTCIYLHDALHPHH